MYSACVRIVAVGFIAYDLVGGWTALNQGLAKVALVKGTKWGVTPGDGYSAYLAIPGVIQFTAGLVKKLLLVDYGQA